MGELTADELVRIGRYLYGARWQTSLARGIRVSPRLVRYLASGRRPVSDRCAKLIAEHVQDRHVREVSAKQLGYLSLTGSVRSPQFQLWLVVRGA